MKFKKLTIKKKADKAIKKIEQIAKEMSSESKVKVGLPKGSNNYPDGTSVVMVGTVHEFGSEKRNVPERSFLRSTMHENKRRYKLLMKAIGLKIALGELTVEKALGKIGLTVQTDVVDKITDLKDPPLVYREGNPLVDTGHLRQSITYEINE